jgi:hypothetical protein
MSIIYHYTKGYNLNGILKAGEIKREGDAGSGMPFATASAWPVERQVWLTAEAEMPFTATPMIGRIAGVNEFVHIQRDPTRGYKHWVHLVNGVWRFAFDAEEISAVRYRYGNVRRQLVEQGRLSVFEKVAKMGNDNISKWYHTNREISLDLCKGLDTWTSQNGWEAVDISQLQQRLAA